MSRMLAPVTIELSSQPHPNETRWLIFTRDGVEIVRIERSADGNLALLNTHLARVLADRGSTIDASNIALSGNWGTDPALVVNAGSNDTRGIVQITNGTGGASGSRSWTLTYKDGVYAATPFALVNRLGGGSVDNVTASISALTVTISGLGAEGAVVPFYYQVLG